MAIANSRLICANESGVTFRYKDYRIKGRERYKLGFTDALSTNPAKVEP